MDLKNAQEGSMTEELIGFISHYLSFSLTFSLFHSLSRSALHTFSFGILDTLSHHQTCAFTINIHFYLSVSHSFTLLPFSLNQSIWQSFAHWVSNIHKHTHTHSSPHFHYARTFDMLRCDCWPHALLSVLSFTLQSHKHTLLLTLVPYWSFNLRQNVF